MNTSALTPRPRSGLFALTLLIDGRFPAGGHAHSGGMEAAIRAGRVHDTASLEQFLHGRITTTGAVTAAFAAATCAALHRDPSPTTLHRELDALDAELQARTPSPALRETSRMLGRQLTRTARAIHPDPGLDTLATTWPQGPHQPLALGASARALGLGPSEAAIAALHEAATGPATAAIRLLGLDPFSVHAVLAGLGPRMNELAHAATHHATSPAPHLPAPTAPMLDVSAEHHATWEVRLFAS